MKSTCIFVFTLLFCFKLNAQFCVQATAAKDSICLGDSVLLSLNIDSTCTPTSSNNCFDKIITTSSSNSIESGVPTASPSLYGNYVNGTKNQLLYKAHKLKNLDMKPGKIKSLSWNIGQFNSNATLKNFTISVALIHPDTLHLNNWIDNLQLVYTHQGYIPKSGWNEHILNTPFLWDGISNIVIQVCHYSTQNGSANSKLRVSVDSSSRLHKSGNFNVCDSVIAPTVYHQIPNLKILYCHEDSSLNEIIWNSECSGIETMGISKQTSFYATAAPCNYYAQVTRNGIQVESNSAKVYLKENCLSTKIQQPKVPGVKISYTNKVLEFAFDELNDLADIIIYSSLGEVVFSKRIFNSTTVEVPTDTWVRGLYFYTIKTNNFKRNGKFVSIK